MDCLVTSRVAAPCAQCGQYSDYTHVIDSRTFYCESCCPVHNAVAIVEPVLVHTTREHQRDFFKET